MVCSSWSGKCIFFLLLSRRTTRSITCMVLLQDCVKSPTFRHNRVWKDLNWVIFCRTLCSFILSTEWTRRDRYVGGLDKTDGFQSLFSSKPVERTVWECQHCAESETPWWVDGWIGGVSFHRHQVPFQFYSPWFFLHGPPWSCSFSQFISVLFEDLIIFFPR